jgi:hypothetical protein
MIETLLPDLSLDRPDVPDLKGLEEQAPAVQQLLASFVRQVNAATRGLAGSGAVFTELW